MIAFLKKIQKLKQEEFEPILHLGGDLLNRKLKMKYLDVFKRSDFKYIYYGHVNKEKKVKFYSNIDIFLFSSVYLEGKSLVIYEAFENKKPVFAYYNGCIGEVLGSTFLGKSYLDLYRKIINNSKRKFDYRFGYTKRVLLNI